jgi:2-oxoglutarate dehydrogenase E1 component
MTVAQPSTPASHFHLLRRQAFTSPRRPLIVFAPKSMLRLKAASSAVEDFTQGSFLPVINDQQNLDPNAVKKVLFCSGKIYWDLLAESQKRDTKDVAIVRLEQLYPTPVEEMQTAIAQFRMSQQTRVHGPTWVCSCRATALTSGSYPVRQALRLPREVQSVTLPSRQT